MSRRVVATVTALFLVWQIAVPAVALLLPRPARFGWHMYSAGPGLPEVVFVGDDGVERRIDPLEYIAGPRAEVDYATLFVEQGCRLGDLRLVRVTRPAGDPMEVTCE